MVTCRCFSRITLPTIAVSIAACSQSNDQQVWTTKNQSVLGVTTDTPSLNVGEDFETVDMSSAIQLREPALTVLVQATESRNPQLRANAIEALHAAPEYLEPLVPRLLGDPNRGVRFAAAMSVGKLKFCDLSTLTEPLLHDDSDSVRAAVMFALHRCGKAVDLNPLASMLNSEDPEVKGNAAYVLGEIGERSAVSLLRQSAGQGLVRVPQTRRKIVEMQLAEAMVKLGAPEEIDIIRAALYSTFEEAELAALACQMCGELKDAGAMADLTNIIHRTGDSERPPEIRMGAALAVARIDPDRAMVEVPAKYAQDTKPAIRAQAAYTFGAMHRGGNTTRVALSHLSRLINDNDPLVQVAAAGSILRIQPKGDF